MSPTKQFVRRRFADDWITPSSSEDNGITYGLEPMNSPFRSNYEHVSLKDQAALLLSVASIARSEFTTSPGSPHSMQSLTGLHTQSVPSMSIPNQSFLTPRVDPRSIIRPTTIESSVAICTPSPTRLDFNRARTVSIDSPIPSCPPLTEVNSNVDNVQLSRLMAPFTSQGLLISTGRSLAAKSCLIDNDEETVELKMVDASSASAVSADKATAKVTTVIRSNKKLQGEPPTGTRVKSIVRRKFSWKNYPELEQFLIGNREEYLRFSALNYTLRQKQYNNQLTERLLDLATQHGYIFGSEFGFVTVRDRIRCYYKSFVQSAKKRGILMGYAARKAGLINIEDEIVDEES